MNTSSFYKEITYLAIPTIIESLLQSMVGFVDTLFISKLGLSSVAAVGVSNTVLQIYFAIFLAMGTASTIFVARYMGAKEKEKTTSIVTQSVILAILIGIVFGILSTIFAKPILSVMGADPQVLDVAVPYFKIIATPAVLLSIMYTLGAVLRGAGDTKTPMRIGLWMNLVHIALDYILIFGVFFKGMGIEGAAIASVAARLFAVVLFFHHLYKNGYLNLHLKNWKVQMDVLKDLLKVGVPASLERLFMRVGQVIYFGMIIRMGTEVYAAHTLAGNLTIFSTVIGTGYATATTTLVGKSLGANEIEKAKKVSRTSLQLMGLVMTVSMLLLFLFSAHISPIFTDNKRVMALITVVLGIDVIAQPVTAIISSLTATLQAGGDTKYPMYTTALGIWTIRTMGVYVLGVYLGFGLVGVWASIALDNYVRAALLYGRYRSNKWMKQLAS